MVTYEGELYITYAEAASMLGVCHGTVVRTIQLHNITKYKTAFPRITVIKAAEITAARTKVAKTLIKSTRRQTKPNNNSGRTWHPAADYTCENCGQTFQMRVSAAARRKSLCCCTQCYKERALARKHKCSICGAVSRADICRECTRSDQAISLRFFKFVNVNGATPVHCPEIGPCWEWTGAKTPLGYPHFSCNGKSVYGHRVSYELHIGSVPDGLEVCHACDNPSCVRPTHLFVATHKKNIEDRDNKGRGRFKRRPKTLPLRARKDTWLSEDVVREMRARYSSGLRVTVIAKAFNKPYNVVHRVVTGQTYTEVA